MRIQTMQPMKELWAVADDGDVIYDEDREWIHNEFPTQLHVRLVRRDGSLWLGNDDLTYKLEITNTEMVENVDIAVIAFSAMIESIIEMQG